MAAVLQQAAVLQAVPGAFDGSDDPDAPAIARLAAALPADETQLCYSIALHGRAELALAPDEDSGLVMVLLRMLAFRPAGAERPPAPPRPAAAQAPRTAVAAAAPLDRFSFPSGHTLHAVSFTTVCCAPHPELAPALVPFAMLVAASRPVLGLHYPSDVLAGAALGGALASLVLAF